MRIRVRLLKIMRIWIQLLKTIKIRIHNTDYPVANNTGMYMYFAGNVLGKYDMDCVLSNIAMV